MSISLERDVMWSGTLGDAALPRRIDAAARSGFAEISLGVHDHQFAPDAREIRARARARGVELSIYDCVVDWYPHLPPKRSFPPGEVTVDEVIHIGNKFEIDFLVATAPLPTELTRPELAGHLAALADRVAALGWELGFEFTPRSPISDLTGACELLRMTDRPNVGLVLDTWHFYRSSSTLDALRQLPGENVAAVQISDGDEPFVENLLADTYRHRRLPGEGHFELESFVQILDAAHGLNRVGPEVLSIDLAKLSPDEVAQLAADSLDGLAKRATLWTQDR